MSERKAITEEMGIHKEWMAESRKQTMETLPDFLRKLTKDYTHDYGTICHAIAAAAIGAAWAVERTPEGGITGFQAGCIIWEIINGWDVFGPGPKKMLCYENLLYPQYEYHFTSITASTAEWIKMEAKKKLAEKSEAMSPNVRDHLIRIAEGMIPFGLRVTRD